MVGGIITRQSATVAHYLADREIVNE